MNRARLRQGTLLDELLRPGPEVVLRSGSRHVTRDHLLHKSGEVAGGLVREGIGLGDRDALFARNSLDWVVAYLGILRVGATAVMINPDYRATEADHILGRIQMPWQ